MKTVDTKRATVAIASISVLVVLGFVVAREVRNAPPELLVARGAQEAATSPTATISPTPDPFSNNWPILTASEAISRSVGRIPPGISTSEPFTRLMTLQDAIDNSVVYLGPHWNYDTPVWVVGMHTAEIVDQQIMGESPFGITPAPAEGAFYVWDANGGLLIAEGVFDHPSDPSAEYLYSDYENLPNNPLQIMTATIIPTEPISTGEAPTYPPPKTPVP